MEKVSGEMDLEEWEVLPDDGFLDFHHKDGKGLFSRKPVFDPKAAVDMDYFICPSPATRQLIETPGHSTVPRGRNQLIPVPIRLKPMLEKNPDRELVKEIREVPIVEIGVASPVVLEKIKDPNLGADLDPISQVFFKKMKENEFVDMKMDSPRSSGRGLKPQIDLGAIQFEEKEEEACKGEDLEHKPAKMLIHELETGKNSVGPEIKEEGGFSIWRWRVTGIGALCSLGVAAAAAISIFIVGNHQRHKQQHQNQKLRLQIYADDKSIKQVVHQATRLNQVLSSVRGVPLTRAHISFGGYYEGL